MRCLASGVLRASWGLRIGYSGVQMTPVACFIVFQLLLVVPSEAGLVLPLAKPLVFNNLAIAF